MPVSIPQTAEDFAAYYQLRFTVLRAPWHQPPGSERAPDDDAPGTVHAFLRPTPNGPVGAVGRLHASAPGQGQIRFMAVQPEYQRQGLGQQVLSFLEDEARQRGLTECILHARESAVPFYQVAGYAVVAPSHTLFGNVPHFLMRKLL